MPCVQRHPKAKCARMGGSHPLRVPEVGTQGAPRGIPTPAGFEHEAAPTAAAAGFFLCFSHSAAGCDLWLSPKRCHVAELPWAPAPSPRNPAGGRWDAQGGFGGWFVGFGWFSCAVHGAFFGLKRQMRGKTEKGKIRAWIAGIASVWRVQRGWEWAGHAGHPGFRFFHSSFPLSKCCGD